MESIDVQAAEPRPRAGFVAARRRPARHHAAAAEPYDPAASTTDPDGRVVAVLESLWHGKILRDHPEMAPHLDAVVAVVHTPDHVADDPRDDRVRYYRRHVGPSRWLLAVVSYEQ